MPLLTETLVRNAAREPMQKSARFLVLESSLNLNKNFDIFLSHSIKDQEIVLGTVRVLKSFGYSVYVDWIEDSQLDRTKVNNQTANLLRKRMSKCKALLYLSTENSSSSKWMPWELGFFDGLKNGRVAIIPIVKIEQDSFSGQEYLGIYPFIDIDFNTAGKKTVWVNKTTDVYGNLRSWIDDGNSAIQKHA